jgi:hypothetical protein
LLRIAGGVGGGPSLGSWTVLLRIAEGWGGAPSRSQRRMKLPVVEEVDMVSRIATTDG